MIITLRLRAAYKYRKSNIVGLFKKDRNQRVKYLLFNEPNLDQPFNQIVMRADRLWIMIPLLADAIF